MFGTGTDFDQMHIRLHDVSVPPPVDDVLFSVSGDFESPELSAPIITDEPDPVFTLTGSDGSDDVVQVVSESGLIIEGAGGNDTLIGGVGDDVLSGGSATDTLFGGSGAGHAARWQWR